MTGAIKKFFLGSVAGALFVAGLNLHSFLDSYDNPARCGVAVTGWPLTFRAIGGFAMDHRFDHDALLYDFGALILIAFLAGWLSVNLPARNPQVFGQSLRETAESNLHRVISSHPVAKAAAILHLLTLLLLSLGLLLVLYALLPIYQEFLGPYGWSLSTTPNGDSMEDYRRFFFRWFHQVDLLTWLALGSLLSLLLLRLTDLEPWRDESTSVPVEDR